MAWMNQERKAKIATAMKPIMQKYGIKGTFKCSKHAITFSIKSGPIDFIGDLQTQRQFGYVTQEPNKDEMRKRYELSINPYWYQEHYMGVSKAFLDEVIPAMKSADHYDRSDAMTDYFDTAYYYHINVGSWDKPYDLTK